MKEMITAVIRETSTEATIQNSYATMDTAFPTTISIILAVPMDALMKAGIETTRGSLRLQKLPAQGFPQGNPQSDPQGE